MTETNKTIQIDGKDYNVSSFNEKQTVLFNHCVDLENQVNMANFRLQQLQVSKDAFVGLLKGALAENDVVTTGEVK
jgi:hypothetical protein